MSEIPKTVLYLDGEIRGEQLASIEERLGELGIGLRGLEYDGLPPGDLSPSYEQMTEEELRAGIENEFLRIFKWEFDTKKFDEFKVLVGFSLTGPDTPEWLQDKELLMSSNAEIIKIRDNPMPDHTRKFYEQQSYKKPTIYTDACSLTYYPKDEPFTFYDRPANSEGKTLSLEEYCTVMAERRGFDYTDVDSAYLPALYATLCWLEKPITD